VSRTGQGERLQGRHVLLFGAGGGSAIACALPGTVSLPCIVNLTLTNHSRWRRSARPFLHAISPLPPPNAGRGF
jgi:hypothetical protein